MVTDNSRLKSDKVGNGTLCRVRRVKLKNNAPPLKWKNWDGYKVYTVNARHVEHVKLERFPETEAIKTMKKDIAILRNSGTNDGGSSSRLIAMESKLKSLQEKRRFCVTPVKLTASVEVTLDDSVSIPRKLTGVSMFQLPLNMNDATTGHKLQGMSKDELVVGAWSFLPNWIYVVLSRVRTLKGLFLLKPLPLDCLEKLAVPRELLAFEGRMRDLEQSVLQRREQYRMQQAARARGDREQ